MGLLRSFLYDGNGDSDLLAQKYENKDNYQNKHNANDSYRAHTHTSLEPILKIVAIQDNVHVYMYILYIVCAIL